MSPDPSFQQRLQAALARVVEDLLSARNAQGHWTGELSSSGLSTATAVCALAIVQRANGNSEFHASIARGLNWLAQYRNQDGGWGDTAISLSNLSTTVLAWSAFGAVPGADETYRPVLTEAEGWIRARAGSLEPRALAAAIIQRYGKDRTFSAPILTLCALAGRLGEGRAAWRWVIPLPFELAACPPRWFAALRLPVVSYALPALIAIGQARHYHCPSRNPLARGVRNLLRRRTLDVLEKIQPINGGFLEATPLTSFVSLSLAGSGQARHHVCRKGIEFLCGAQRPDGSWPIDTNLATWVTTLSVDALKKVRGTTAEPLASEIFSEPAPSSSPITAWLLAQQYRHEHPYTHAAPGGWAWTDLPGGVPDADDTAGALLALRPAGPVPRECLEAAIAGVTWLMDLQNEDGGIPTFCRGWGTLPFDRSSADLTAHALRAWTAWLEDLPNGLRERVKAAMGRALVFLGEAQRADGSWVPLWFGNQHSPTEENPTYGTARVLQALADPSARFRLFWGIDYALEKGVAWLLQAQNADGSWGGARATPGSVEETALAVEALAQACADRLPPAALSRETMAQAVGRGTNWLLARVESGEWKQPAPIGFYFAKLWYFERLYPLIFTVGALGQAARLFQRAD